MFSFDPGLSDIFAVVVLFLWIYVMYNGNKAVTGFLALLYVACAAATYTMLSISFQGLQGELAPLFHAVR